MEMFRDIRWGTRWAAWMVGIYAIFASILYAVGLGLSDMTLPAVIAAYAVVGLASGALLGLLRPLAQSKRGSMVLGALIAFSIYYPLALFGTRNAPVEKLPGTVVLAVLCALFGGAYGKQTWKRTHRT
jgi:MFS-type transporter involved in bile tolerance (Atg22 family)